MSNEPIPENKATAICSGRAGSADHVMVVAPSGNTRGVSDQTCEQQPARRKPAVRNKPMAIGSDSAEHSGEVGSALTRQSGNSALRNLSAEFCDVQDANHKEGRKRGRAQSCLFLPSCLPQIVLAAFG